MEKLFAGAGREEIHFPGSIFPFREGPDIWSGIHDDICTRVVLFENNNRWGLISIDLVIIENDMAAEIKRIVSGISGIPEENLWISVTHTTSMPHMFERDHDGVKENNLAYRMKRKVIAAVADAAKTAAESMRPVCFGYGEGTCTVNTNRMIPTCDGWWIGNGEEFPSDHSVPVIRIDDQNGKPYIILYNYACELSVMDKSVMHDGGRHMTADLSGITSKIIEKNLGQDVTAIFMPGPSSDQGPVYRARRVVRGFKGSYRTIDIRDDGWLLLQLAGERLAEQVLVTAGNIQSFEYNADTHLHADIFSFPGQKLKGLPNPLREPMRNWISRPDGEKTRGVEMLVINDMVIISAGGLGAKSVMHIKEKSPFKKTIFVEHVIGSLKPLATDGIKGMADAASYDLGTVHAKNSEFAKGSAELMVQYILSMLEQICASKNDF